MIVRKLVCLEKRKEVVNGSRGYKGRVEDEKGVGDNSVLFRVL